MKEKFPMDIASKEFTASRSHNGTYIDVNRAIQLIINCSLTTHEGSKGYPSFCDAIDTPTTRSRQFREDLAMHGKCQAKLFQQNIPVVPPPSIMIDASNARTLQKGDLWLDSLG